MANVQRYTIEMQHYGGTDGGVRLLETPDDNGRWVVYGAWETAHQRAKELETEVERLRVALLPHLAGCGHCEWDEAEGGLIDHCDQCCRKVMTAVWHALNASTEGEG